MTEIINTPFFCKPIQFAPETVSHRHYWGRKVSLEKDKLTSEPGLLSADTMACLVQKPTKITTAGNNKFTKHLLNARNFLCIFSLVSLRQTFQLCKADSSSYLLFTSSQAKTQVFFQSWSSNLLFTK